MKKICFAIKFSLVFLGIMANAQMKDELKTPNIIPPSPTVANLMNFEEVPVDHYTGQPDISVPVYSKALSSDLSLHIVLKYSTLGLRLEQPGGWLGRGWSLDAGGVISRTVRGQADELPGTGNVEFVKGVFHNDDFWNFENIALNDKHKFIWNANGSPTGTYDYQPDLFQISMPGFSGRFIIVKDGTSFTASQIDMTQNLKITIVWGNDRVIIGFIVLDANGYRYTFGLPNGDDTPAIETSSTETTTHVRPRDPDDNIQSLTKPPLKIINSAWMLTSIKTANGRMLAKFEYSDSEETYKTPVTMTYNDFREPTIGKFYVDANKYNCSVLRPISVQSFAETVTQTKKLSKIIFRDKSSVTLSTAGSNPENDGTLLSNISIYKKISDSNQSVRNYTLSYDTNNNGKVFLKSIGSSTEFRYSFEYEDMVNFGNPMDYADNWGYTNGDYRSTTGQYLFDAYKKGALTTMTSRSKGVKDFIWEPHTYSYEGNVLISDFDNNPNNMEDTPPIHHYFEVNENGFESTDPGMQIVITHAQYVYLTKNILPASPLQDDENFQVEFIKSGYSTFALLKDLPKALLIKEPGIYTIKVKVRPTLASSNDRLLKGYINIQYKKIKDPLEYQNCLLGGGLRISKIDFYDSANESDKLKRFNYNYNMSIQVPIPLSHETRTLIVSSGSTDTKMGSRYREYDSEDKRIVFTDWAFGQSLIATFKYHTRTNTLNAQLTRGGYVGYKRVAAEEGMSVGGAVAVRGSIPKGYTEYIFTNAIDEPGNIGAFVYPYVEFENADMMRGLLKSKTTYNSAGVKLTEEINEYEPVENFIVKTYALKPKPCEWTVFYNNYYNYANIFVENPVPTSPAWAGIMMSTCGPPPPFDSFSIDIKAGRAFLTSTITKQYFNNADPIVKKTDYTYLHGWNYQVLTQTDTYKEGTDDVIFTTEYQYPVGGYNIDFFDTDEENVLNEMGGTYNMINKPVVIYSSRNGALLNTVVNIYKKFAVGQTQQSQPNSDPTNMPSDQILLHKVKTLKGPTSQGVPEERLKFNSYNIIGNVTDVSMTDGMHTSYIWGYEDTLPIAKIDDKEYADIPVNLRDAAISASNSGVEADLMTALNALQNNNSLSLQHVTTLSHDTVYGVTSMTDPKGLKLTYGYDYLGRLIWVKDKYDKLVTEYVYKFKGLF